MVQLKSVAAGELRDDPMDAATGKPVPYPKVHCRCCTAPLPHDTEASSLLGATDDKPCVASSIHRFCSRWSMHTTIATQKHSGGPSHTPRR